jgi:hypothetical protein
MFAFSHSAATVMSRPAASLTIVSSRSRVGLETVPARHRRGRALGDVTTLRDPAVTEQLKGRVKEMLAAED